jgi:hypoxanthine phosphoribosyltransferase
VETAAEFEVPTWSQIYAMLVSQAEKIRCSGFKSDVIVGVTRGGWVPARVLSDSLEIHALATVGVEFYLGVSETISKPVLTQGVSLDVRGKKVLLVDDVTDTGGSLRLAIEHLEQRGVGEVQVATVYRKPLSVITPEFYEKETQCWVVFPWEVKETLKNILRKHGGSVKVVAEKLVKAGLPIQLVEEFLKEAGEAAKC